MILKFRIISNENDDFILDIAIDGTSSFLALHQHIQKELSYDPMQMASFFITDHEWNKDFEITLMDMMGDESADIMTMEKAIIEDYIASNKQRMLYVFDLFSERAFFIETSDIQKGNIDSPITENIKGNAPLQLNIDLTSTANDSLDSFEVEEELDELYKGDDEIDDSYDISDLPDGKY